jgi:lincosamide nucleotidyltransferase A/C/D/E
MKLFMTSDDVITIYKDLGANNIHIWIDGGWCVDALLGKQTRAHPDLDIAVDRKDADRLKERLISWSYKDEPRTDTTDWNYAMANGSKLIDVHIFEIDEHGNNVYGIEYPKDSLTGTGIINGHQVNCIAPEWMFKFKTAYEPKDKDLKDVQALSAKFSFELPDRYKT